MAETLYERAKRLYDEAIALRADLDKIPEEATTEFAYRRGRAVELAETAKFALYQLTSNILLNGGAKK